MKSGQVQLAMRDLRAEFSQPAALVALAGVAVVMGVSGPFGTLEAFSLLPRLAYWGAVVPMTYAAGFLGTKLAAPYTANAPRALRTALAALGSAIMVTLVLAALNAALNIQPSGARELIVGFAAVYVICFVIETVSVVVQRQSPPETLGLPSTPAILSRLSASKRGALLALTAEDHYTTVITSKGREMVLMRIADAIALTQPVTGIQIHRSHWVALAGVANVQRARGGAEVFLTNGEHLPIARARMADARRAGLLPQRGS